MPKKVLFESAIHQLASAAKRRLEAERISDPARAGRIRHFIESWHFENAGKGKATLHWNYPATGTKELNFSEADFYHRGDNSEAAKGQRELGLCFSPDSVKNQNARFFDSIFSELLSAAGF